MRYVLPILLLLILPAWSHAQKVRMKLANSKYEQFHYADAIMMFEDIVASNPNNFEATEKLAHSYRKINNSKKAEEWYAKVVQNAKSQPINLLYYAQALAMNGKYSESRQWFAAYSAAAKNDPRGDRFARAYADSVMRRFFQDSARYKVDTVGFNSPQADFSPMFFRSGIIFSSNRTPAETTPVKHTFQWNKTPYLDLYVAPSGGNTAYRLRKDINSRYHEGPVAFYRSYDSIIFTRNNYLNGKYQTSKDKTNKLKLYFANTKTDASEEWTNITEFPYNSNEYSTGHPALSTDGQTLYFVSDMPGGYGGTDIYMSVFRNGRWGKPQNLGAEINTKGNEMFPFIDENGDLYFASNGHPGLGGLDIFVARSKNSKYTAPKNIGAPINSSQDDFALIYSEDTDEGYFTSNRDGGMGDDDIYRFTVKRCKFIIVAVNARTKEIITQAKVEAIDEETGANTRVQALNDTLFMFKPRFQSNYKLRAVKEGFNEGFSTIADSTLSICLLKGLDVSDTIYIPLEPVTPLVAKEGDKPPVSESTGRPRYRYKGDPNVKVIEVKNIYYDFDKFNIRPDAAKELDKLLVLMNEYPSLKVELSSHTDTRADNLYNIRLAQRRSRSAYNYLVMRGIDPSRLIVNSFGENKLVVDCPDFSDCSEEEHQLNRRTEIIVLSY
jgi:outer membrane protein OmpA-like peptidoglycan-associated protein/tetratricopeptide (TPR) repeat protein